MAEEKVGGGECPRGVVCCGCVGFCSGWGRGRGEGMGQARSLALCCWEALTLVESQVASWGEHRVVVQGRGWEAGEGPEEGMETKRAQVRGRSPKGRARPRGRVVVGRSWGRVSSPSPPCWTLLPLRRTLPPQDRRVPLLRQRRHTSLPQLQLPPLLLEGRITLPLVQRHCTPLLLLLQWHRKQLLPWPQHRL